VCDTNAVAAILDYVRKHPKHTSQVWHRQHPFIQNNYTSNFYERMAFLTGAQNAAYTLQRNMRKFDLSGCKERAHWTKKEWETYIWSDECSIERGRGKVWEWVFCTPKERYAPQMVQIYSKSRDLSIMVGGTFGEELGGQNYIF